MNGEKGVAHCVDSLCVHALLSSLCVFGGVALIGMRRTEREKTRKRKKNKHKKQLFSPFFFFSL